MTLPTDHSHTNHDIHQTELEEYIAWISQEESKQHRYDRRRRRKVH